MRCQPDADGYCLACDPERRRPIPAGAKRNCRRLAPEAVVAARRAACRECWRWNDSQGCAAIAAECGCPGSARDEYGRRLRDDQPRCPAGWW